MSDIISSFGQSSDETVLFYCNKISRTLQQEMKILSEHPQNEFRHELSWVLFFLSFFLSFFLFVLIQSIFFFFS